MLVSDNQKKIRTGAQTPVLMGLLGNPFLRVGV